MKIAVILASSQRTKNQLVYETVKTYASGHEVINFGCKSEEENYSYIEISIMVGLLLASGAIDFVVTGCSSGQGMMLACNTMPGVICGYAPTPQDAYLFAQINNGNAISLPLGEAYTYTGSDNLIQTIKRLFSEPFGQGYPKEDAARKLRDTEFLKEMKRKTHIDTCAFLRSLDEKMIGKVLSKQDVIEYILNSGSKKTVLSWLAELVG